MDVEPALAAFDAADKRLIFAVSLSQLGLRNAERAPLGLQLFNDLDVGGSKDGLAWLRHEALRDSPAEKRQISLFRRRGESVGMLLLTGGNSRTNATFLWLMHFDVNFSEAQTKPMP